jgi:hypothetical protein
MSPAWDFPFVSSTPCLTGGRQASQADPCPPSSGCHDPSCVAEGVPGSSGISVSDFTMPYPTRRHSSHLTNKVEEQGPRRPQAESEDRTQQGDNEDAAGGLALPGNCARHFINDSLNLPSCHICNSPCHYAMTNGGKLRPRKQMSRRQS